MAFFFWKKPPDIARMKEKGDIVGLIKALGYQEDPHVRTEAAKTLGTIKNNEQRVNIINSLVDAMNDKNSEVRESIVVALGELGNNLRVEKLIDKIISLKHDPEKQVEMNMFAGVLDKVYPINAMSILTDLMTNSNETVRIRKLAEQALESIGIKPSVEALADIREQLNKT